MEEREALDRRYEEELNHRIQDFMTLIDELYRTTREKSAQMVSVHGHGRHPRGGKLEARQRALAE
jgi:hypothetical protein